MTITNILFPSKQFFKFIHLKYPNLEFTNSDTNYFNCLNPKFNVSGYNDALEYFLQDTEIKNKFQRFLNEKCFVLNIEKIELDDLACTCNTAERQTILLMLFLYYFV